MPFVFSNISGIFLHYSTWEQIHNPNFKVVEFDHFRMQAGLPNFVLSASEWIESICVSNISGIFFTLLLHNSKKCSNFAVANQKFADIL